jgi:hypothetical protein
MFKNLLKYLLPGCKLFKSSENAIEGFSLFDAWYLFWLQGSVLLCKEQLIELEEW